MRLLSKRSARLSSLNGFVLVRICANCTTFFYIDSLRHYSFGDLGPRFGDPPRIHYTNVDALNSCSLEMVVTMDSLDARIILGLRFEDSPVIHYRNIGTLNSRSLDMIVTMVLGLRFEDPPVTHYRDIGVFNSRSLDVIVTTNSVIHYRDVSGLDGRLPDMTVTIDSHYNEFRVILDRCFPTFGNMVEALWCPLITLDKIDFIDVIDIASNSATDFSGSYRANVCKSKQSTRNVSKCVNSQRDAHDHLHSQTLETRIRMLAHAVTHTHPRVAYSFCCVDFLPLLFSASPARSLVSPLGVPPSGPRGCSFVGGVLCFRCLPCFACLLCSCSCFACLLCPV